MLSIKQRGFRPHHEKSMRGGKIDKEKVISTSMDEGDVGGIVARLANASASRDLGNNTSPSHRLASEEPETKHTVIEPIVNFYIQLLMSEDRLQGGSAMYG